jgi:hypothetical protein
MAQPQRASPAIPPAPFARPACPRCKAQMMLVSACALLSHHAGRSFGPGK